MAVGDKLETISSQKEIAVDTETNTTATYGQVKSNDKKKPISEIYPAIRFITVTFFLSEWTQEMNETTAAKGRQEIEQEETKNSGEHVSTTEAFAVT